MEKLIKFIIIDMNCMTKIHIIYVCFYRRHLLEIYVARKIHIWDHILNQTIVKYVCNWCNKRCKRENSHGHC